MFHCRKRVVSCECTAKNQPSNGKMRAFEQFKNGRNYKEIAACLGVQEPTTQVYTIDALAAGAPLDLNRMANLLEVTEATFSTIRAAVSSNETPN